MTEPVPTPGDPRIYLAAERTLLAWVRTGLAMMGFGFVVARFGLFLREVAAVQGAAPAHSIRASLWIGTALVVLGVVVDVLAAVVYVRTVRRLDAGRHLEFRAVSLGVVTAGLLALLGLATAAYLAFGFTHA